MGGRNPVAEICTLRQRLDDAKKHHERRALLERQHIMLMTKQIQREDRADKKKARTA